MPITAEFPSLGLMAEACNSSGVRSSVKEITSLVAKGSHATNAIGRSNEDSTGKGVEACLVPLLMLFTNKFPQIESRRRPA